MSVDYQRNKSVVARVTREPSPISSKNYPYYPVDPTAPLIVENPDGAWWENLPTWGTDAYEEDRPTTPTQIIGNLTPEQRKLVKDIEDMATQNKTVAFAKSQTTDYTKNKYTSYSYTGIDMVPSMTIPGYGPYVFGDISTMSVSSHRESFPVRTLGRTNSLGFTHGPRTIAGSLIFSILDVHPFYRMAELVYEQSAKSVWDQGTTGVYPLADALPPFDITVTFNNEYRDSGAVMRIFGVVIIDDGMTLSIDDLVTENTFSFMASGIAPLHKAKGWSVSS